MVTIAEHRVRTITSVYGNESQRVSAEQMRDIRESGGDIKKITADFVFDKDKPEYRVQIKYVALEERVK